MPSPHSPTTRSTSFTPNGLTAHDLVVHLAAQESLLAQNLGVPTIADLDEEQIVARTHALLPRFADRDLDDAVELWRASVEANREWAVANPDRTAIWRGLGLTRDDTLLVRSFEAWVHGDDWLLAMGDGEPAVEPDVTVTADVVDWCLLVGDRIDPDVIHYEVDGDPTLGRDLVAAAPALATL